MPVVIFTLHTYGSWMPDRPQGYVERGHGIKPPDPELAERYRERMTREAVFWTHAQQRTVVEAVLEKCRVKAWKAHAVATESSHVHAVLSWSDEMKIETARKALKYSITKALNDHYGKRLWLGRKGSNQRVKDADHLGQLCDAYLPGHRGWRYDRRTGLVAPKPV